MTFKADLAADRAVFLDPNEFGVEATYTPSGGQAKTIHVLLDESPGMADGEVFQVQGLSPQITADSADVPNLGAGDTFAIDGTTYLIRGAPPEPDVGGLVRIPVVEQ